MIFRRSYYASPGLCPTCEMAYGNTVEGPWVSCGHDTGRPLIPRPIGGILALLWQPVAALDYLRIDPSLWIAVALFVPFSVMQMTMVAVNPRIQSKLFTTYFLWVSRFGHTSNPYVLGFFGMLVQLLGCVLIAFALQETATMLEGRGRYESILAATLFVEAILGWRVWVPYPGVWLALRVVENAFLILSVSRLYGLSLGWSLWARTLSLVIQPGLFLLALMTVLSVAKIGSHGSSHMLRRPRIESMNVTAALNWTVQGLDGKSFLMQQVRGHVTVVNIWATWCGPCRMEMPALEKLSQALQGTSIQIMEISNESPETITHFLKKNPSTLSFYTREGDFPEEFTTEGIPATFILDTEGHIVGEEMGGADWSDPTVVQYLRDLAAGVHRRPPSPRQRERIRVG